jgi:hypothetical protein
MGSERRPWLVMRWAGLAYTVVAALFVRNLLPHAGSYLYSDLGDPLLNASIMAWNAAHLPLSADWWNFPSFAPLTGVTAFTEHMLLTYPVATPVIWLTGNPVLAYNIVMLIAMPLNGLAAFALGRELTGSAAAAFIAGLAYAFAPYQAGHLSHLQQMTSFGMPFALLWLHRYLKTGRRAALVGFGTGWLLTALANSALLVFFPVLVALWSVWFIRPHEWRRLVGPLVAAVVATLPLVPLLWGYSVRQSEYGFRREYEEIKSFSADMIGLVGLHFRVQSWKGLLPHEYGEGVLFPGFTVLTLAIVAVVQTLRSFSPPSAAAARGDARSLWARRLIRGFGTLTVVVLARIWTGPWGWHFGPLPLPPFSPYQVFTAAVVLLVCGLALTSGFRDAWARRSVVIFYAVAAVTLWLMALGPEPEWSTPWRALAYGPYWLLWQLPGVQSIRVPARAWFPATLCLSMLAAFGTAALLKRHARPRPHLIAALALLVVAEGWSRDLVVEVPPLTRRGAIPVGAVVLDLPMDEGFQNAVPQYRAVMGGYRTINGYSGYEPMHFNPLRHAIADGVPEALTPYRQHNDLYVIVRRGVPPELMLWVAQRPGAEHVFDIESAVIYRLPRLRETAATIAR